MQNIPAVDKEQIAIRTDLAAIFVSLELSRSTASVCDGESAHPTGGGPPSYMPGAQGSDERARQYVNRIKGLLFAQGVGDYEPMRINRRERLEELTTGDGRPLGQQLKAQLVRELGLELTLVQIKGVEAERDTLHAADLRTVAT